MTAEERLVEINLRLRRIWIRLGSAARPLEDTRAQRAIAAALREMERIMDELDAIELAEVTRGRG